MQDDVNYSTKEKLRKGDYRGLSEEELSELPSHIQVLIRDQLILEDLCNTIQNIHDEYNPTNTHKPERVVFLVSRSLLNVTSSRSRARRSPVRSAAKSSGDGNAGEDSDGSDPEPPRLKHRPLAALFSLEGRRAA